MALLPTPADLGRRPTPRPTRPDTAVSGSAMSAPARALQGVGEDVTQLGNERLDRWSSAVARERDAAVADRIRNLLYDPETGYMNRSGRDALGGQEELNAQLEAIRNEALAGINNVARDRLAPGIQRRIDGALDNVLRREGDQLRVYETAVSEARISSAYEDAIAGGPSVFDTSLDTIRQEVAADIARAGVADPDGEVFRSRFGAAASQMFRNHLTQLAEDDPAAALNFLEQHREDMLPSDVAEMEPLLTTMRNEQAGRDLARGGGAPTSAGAFTGLENIRTPRAPVPITGAIAGVNPGLVDTTALAWAYVLPDATIEVTTGVSSHSPANHAPGRALDFRVTRADGSVVRWDDPEALAASQVARAMGIGGIGAGPEYMGGSHFHWDINAERAWNDSGAGQVNDRGGAANWDLNAIVNAGGIEAWIEQHGGGDGAARATPAGGAFPQTLITTESGGDWAALNDEEGSGGIGHGGRLQFSHGRLADAARAGIIGAGMTPQQFAQAPQAVQMAVEDWHFADIDREIDALGVLDTGLVIEGVVITRDGLRAVAHLGGIQGMQDFVRTGGAYNPEDANETSLLDYARIHGASGDTQGTNTVGGLPGAGNAFDADGNYTVDAADAMGLYAQAVTQYGEEAGAAFLREWQTITTLQGAVEGEAELSQANALFNAIETGTRYMDIPLQIRQSLPVATRNALQAYEQNMRSQTATDRRTDPDVVHRLNSMGDGELAAYNLWDDYGALSDADFDRLRTRQAGVLSESATSEELRTQAAAVLEGRPDPSLTPSLSSIRTATSAAATAAELEPRQLPLYENAMVNWAYQYVRENGRAPSELEIMDAGRQQLAQLVLRTGRNRTLYAFEADYDGGTLAANDDVLPDAREFYTEEVNTWGGISIDGVAVDPEVYRLAWRAEAMRLNPGRAIASYTDYPDDIRMPSTAAIIDNLIGVSR